MKTITRRKFTKAAFAASAAFTIPFSRVRGANDDIRIAVVGFRSHGHTHIKSFRSQPGTRLVALCDCDQSVLGVGVELWSTPTDKIKGYVDIRKLLDNKDIDVVSTATPNHWHSLVTVWACQAGKDVCVEKPVSHNIFEGRKMVEAARKYGRIVQAGTESRSKEKLHKAIKYIHDGKLGKIILARGFCYKNRTSLGKVTAPTPIPKHINYDLWCGPASNGPLMRKSLHYDWHWVWDTGCGELGNNGPHQLDIIRWVLGHSDLPKRVMSIGGRFGYDDDGETANTQIALYDYKPAPLIYEVRGLPTKPGDRNMDIYQSTSPRGVAMKAGRKSPSPNTGVVIECQAGWVDLNACIAYDNKGKVIKEFEDSGGANNVKHDANFLKAVRSRKMSDLNCEILQGHLSSALCHLGNISHRVGQAVPTEEIKDRIADDKAATESFERFQNHLAIHNVDLKKTPATLGPWLDFDSNTERFTGQFADVANKLVSRKYRRPFIVPENV
jgi:hypothetical protein